MFYHLIISIEGAYEDIVRLDLRESQLEEMVLKPYHDGTPMQIQGKTILIDDITGFKITRTSESSANIAQKNNHSSIDPDFSPLSTERSRIAESGEDVTAEFITVPPGSNKLDKKEAKGNLKTDTRKIFVVHGRDKRLRDSMFSFLRSIGLEPIEWSQAVSGTGKGTPYVGEVLDYAFNSAQAIVVLLTPDDMVYLRKDLRGINEPEYETKLTPQARPNVLFETGIAMGRDEERTVIVEIGELRPFSDIAGRHTVRLNNTPGRRKELAQRLEKAGCEVDLKGEDWLTVGDFSPPEIIIDVNLDEEVSNYQPDEVAEKILLQLSESRRGLSVGQLAHLINKTPEKIKYYLHQLSENEYVGYSLSFNRDTTYHLQQDGREFLIKKDLL